MQSLYRTNARLVEKYGRKKVLFGAGVAGVLLVVLGFSFMGGKDTTLEEAPATPVARTVSLYSISGADNGTAVRAADGNAFIVRAESGGRVERIANVGDVVARGATVAQIENAAQRAAVLQAQGAYEAARASAATSDVGSASAERAYSEALTQAVNTYRGAYASADDVLRNTVDQVFSNPDSTTIGIRIDSNGQALKLIEERKALEIILKEWQAKVSSDISGSVSTLISKAESDTTRLAELVVTLNSLLSEEDAYTDDAALLAFRSDFASARTELNGTLQSLSSARSILIGAKSALDQARIAGTNGKVSLADAQVKQALGVLESARAALSKTTVKTPVAGTVTAVSISVGDIINIGSDVVFVASDEIQEIETGNTVTVPLTAVKFTPSKAYIFTVEDGKLVEHEVTTGSVTTSSIAITGAEGIDTIVLDIRGLKDGDSVVTE